MIVRVELHLCAHCGGYDPLGVANDERGECDACHRWHRELHLFTVDADVYVGTQCICCRGDHPFEDEEQPSPREVLVA